MFTIGQRIKLIRQMRGYTQKQLGMLAGFPSKNADVRIAQYENGTRTPGEEVLRSLALVLGVSSFALDLDSSGNPFHILHLPMAMEDAGFLRFTRKGKKSYMVIDMGNPILIDELNRWADQNAKFMNGEISKEEYDIFRYSRDREAYENDRNISEQRLMSIVMTPDSTDVFVFEPDTQKYIQL